MLDASWVSRYCLKKDGFKKCVRYKKEEAQECHPDNMLPDGTLDPRLK